MAESKPSKKPKETFFSKLLKTEKKEEKKEVKKEGLLGEEIKKFNLIVEDPSKGVEEVYFWFLNFARDNLHFDVEKTSDLFTATEASSFFGDLFARRSQLQEKVANYMGLIANMSKSLFQIIREIRIIKERLSYYEDAKKYHSSDPKEKEAGDAAEIALKSIWVDMVEGGIQNAGSVYGIATKVGFHTLPDFFFRVHAKDKDSVGKVVNSLEGINKKLKEVLERKLYQYYVWKERTYQELKTREKFALKYLSQQHDAMRLYTSWIKPYLRTINKLDLGSGKGFSVTDPDLVTAFETSKIQVELILTKKEFNVEGPYDIETKPYKNIMPVVRVEFIFSSLPSMVFHQNYQRGAVHGGLSRVKVLAYAPKMENYKEYIKQKEEEDFEILKSIDATLESLGDELKKYLAEAENVFALKAAEKEKGKEVKKEDGEPGPFKALGKGFKDLFGLIGSAVPKKSKKAEDEEYDEFVKEEEKNAASKVVVEEGFRLYDYYKKNHQMLSW
ncbi:MAG: hypothetical protein PHT54_02320 [Candidatus Nanoarchaeia archaeon]|nr:hypothetical protein [Candidatus Nanoarchaeia archaeon]